MKDTAENWLAEVSEKGLRIVVKYLSGNDTQLTGSHQAGPYMPKGILQALFPALLESKKANPRMKLLLIVDSHDSIDFDAHIIWYNNKRTSKTGTRDELRITGLGGKKNPLLDSKNTGALAVFAYAKTEASFEETSICRVWVSRNAKDEGEISSYIGNSLPPSKIHVVGVDRSIIERKQLSFFDSIPDSWHSEFPTGRKIFDHVCDKVVIGNPDEDIVERRNLEFELFIFIEKINELPKIKEGFASVEEFIAKSLAITNRRKARSGLSLEYHLEKIFIENNLSKGIDFDHGKLTELNKKPDFIFPSIEKYQNMGFPSEKLTMLAVKNTIKDRWRQILNEAERITEKHLFTLQEGVSINQMEELLDEKVVLVVPKRIHSRFPKGYRKYLMTLTQFIEKVKKNTQQ